MEPLKTYDYLARARQRMFDWIRPLGAEQYSRPSPPTGRTLARTLTHIMISEWYYIERIQGRYVPPDNQWPIQEANPPPFATLEAEWIDQAGRTRTALSAVRDWSADLEYRVTDDDGRPLIITASSADIFTQLVLHEVHHRAHVTDMLRQLGVAVADIDFNVIMYRRREAPPGP